MFRAIIRSLQAGVRTLVVLSLLTGLFYPMVVRALAILCFPNEAGGRLIRQGYTIVGSELVGQEFSSEAYFHPRPSASHYSALPAMASNLGPTSVQLKSEVTKRQAALGQDAPADLLAASASGLDPDISPEAALFQISRIAQARSLNQNEVDSLRKLVVESVRPPFLGFIGKKQVNVLSLNQKLDASFGKPKK